jgi:CRISPR-associated endonuclease Csn1
MKKILGLDLGTNSIGWALIKQDFNNKEGAILGIGSRIIPMSKDIMDKFGSGQSHSQTAERTSYRGVRRLYQRDNLRRERLHRVLNVLNFLPDHYANAIDFDKNLGQFKENDTKQEVKLNYCLVYNKNTGKYDFEFIFKDSFNEMLAEFNKNGYEHKIPYDWTIYYLRKKALVHKISKEELAWLILNFNQKRGYYQLRGEEEDIDENKLKTFETLFVTKVLETEDVIKKTGAKLFDIYFENGWKYDRQTTKPNDWLNKRKEFIVTTTTTKNGDIKRTYKAVDSEKDWIAIKSKTEQDIDISGKTVGQYIYDTLLDNPTQKIRGKLVRTIERKFYKKELKTILETQIQFHPELQDKKIYQNCVEELYPRNEAHQNNIKDKGFVYLFLDDIIFYQRPLKSKKSTISSCAYETRTFKKIIKAKDLNGNVENKEIQVTEGIKAIPKSNPLFQEFRLWQFLSNLRIYKKDIKDDIDITSDLITNEDEWIKLFDFLNFKKEIDQKQMLEYLVKQKVISKIEKENYRWNYVEDKKYPANETRAQFASRLKKVNGLTDGFYFSIDQEKNLWHIVYSVKDKLEFEVALETFAAKNNIDVKSFVENFKKFPPYNNDYGSYSEKAIKKLLPLMRIGKYWEEDGFDPDTLKRVYKIITGEYDENIKNRVREKAIGLNSLSDFRGLPMWLACYIVYDRHSETADTSKWNSPHDIEKFLQEFKQHSLRNPIVEQVVTETLRVVADIWTQYGNNMKDYFSEIHVELGRDMKNPAGKREQISKRNIENENTNVRIRELLKELVNDGNTKGDVRPYSPSHQEILKIYEEGVYQSTIDIDEDIAKIRKDSSPSKSDIKKYKLWLEQGYISPYTGAVIPLGLLFTSDYQIEHIIPQARYFDDSLSNKIICESEVNALKGSQTAYEFLKSSNGCIVELSHGRNVRLFDLEKYENHCNRYFKNNRLKLLKLMSEDIPEGFIERQMNDSRYISKLVKSLLNNIVKDEGEKDFISYKVVPVTGAITSKLKRNWGLNDKWNEIVAPRFIRLNELSNSTSFGYFDEKINAFRCEVPDELKRGFNKKRIDHRHHALDALVIACTTREHINYLNSIESEKDNYSLRDRLLVKNSQDHYTKAMKLPWSNFPVNAYNALEKIIVSFKQNTRVINKTNNKTWQWVKQVDGSYKKQMVVQTKGDNWAIRKPMHKETVSGAVSVRITKEVTFANGIKDWRNLVDKDLKQKIIKLYADGLDEKKIAKYFKVNPYIKDGNEIKNLCIYTYTVGATATRTQLSDKFTKKQLESVTDSGIRKILEAHLNNYKDDNGKEDFA